MWNNLSIKQILLQTYEEMALNISLEEGPKVFNINFFFFKNNYIMMCFTSFHFIYGSVTYRDLRSKEVQEYHEHPLPKYSQKRVSTPFE